MKTGSLQIGLRGRSEMRWSWMRVALNLMAGVLIRNRRDRDTEGKPRGDGG